MDVNSLDKAFHEQLIEMYSALKQLTDIMPDMVAIASSIELQQLLQRYLKLTQHEFDAIQRLFEKIDAKPDHTECNTMSDILADAKTMLQINVTHQTNIRDASLIQTTQKARRFLTVTYESLYTWAKVFNEKQIVHTLSQLIDDARIMHHALKEQSDGYFSQLAGD